MATGFAIASAVLSVAGGIKGAQAAGRAGQTNERILKRNRKLAQFSIEDALQSGAEQTASLQADERRAIGEQRVALAAQGLDVDVGSGADIIMDTNRAIAQDINTVNNNTALAVWGFENEISELKIQSMLNAAETRDKQTATILSAATSAAGSLSGIKFKKKVAPLSGGIAGDPINFGGVA